MSSTPKRVSFGSHGSMVETLIIDDSLPLEEKKYVEENILHKSILHNNHQNNFSLTEPLLRSDGTENACEGDGDSPASGESTTKVTFASSNTEHIDGYTTVINQTTTTKTSEIKNGRTILKTTSHSSQQSMHSTSSAPGGTTSPPHAPIIRLQRSWSGESHENPFQEDGELSKKAEYILRHSTISATQLRISDPDLHKDKPVEEVPLQAISADQAQAAPDQVDAANRPSEINMKENGKVEQPLTPQSVEVEVGTANAHQAQPQQAEQVKVKDDKKCKCCVVM